ncbi:hydrogenase iron-sulfur subunit [bacterium]|nr:hydrogenase iron-sulfur subunit [bacterium]
MKSKEFEPNIIVYACTWCSYAGADLAGVSRLQYPPNVKINRIMCTGRMNPTIILNTFELGIDGVLISGCHFGDCHYISGNEKCDEMVKVAKGLIDLLGIEPERLSFEQISAAEGPKFAQTMTEFTARIKELGPNPLLKKEPAAKIEDKLTLEDIIKKADAYHCYQCSQCVGSCPVSRNRKTHNVRRNVRKAVYGMEDRLLNDLDIWSCLTCGLCTTKCPLNVDYPAFVQGIRQKAFSLGASGTASHDGLFQSIVRVQQLAPHQNRLAWLTDDLKTEDKSDYLYFTGCLPYLDVVFSENGSKPLKIARDTISILNKLGISPMLLDNERCCGHDHFWSGDMASFKQLAEYNLELIRASGAKKVVFSCPECFQVFNKDYREHFGELGFEVVHIVELLSEKLNSNSLALKKNDRKVTFQDSCRLGRFAGLYEEPRNIIKAITGTELVEMIDNRSNSLCCGSTGWTNCFKCAKKTQIERLGEAKDTGAQTLITTCPKCQIHLNCAQEQDEEKIEIKDITNLVAEAMG